MSFRLVASASGMRLVGTQPTSPALPQDVIKGRDSPNTDLNLDSVILESCYRDICNYLDEPLIERRYAFFVLDWHILRLILHYFFS